MKKYRYTALLTFIISLMMVVSVVFPTVASAEDSMTSSATQETTHQDTAEQLTAQDTADELTKKDTADQLITSSPAFDAEKTVDGVKVKVSADANVFPEGTTMEVKKVTLTSQEKKLISEKQDDNKSTIKQYSFDITMKNKDGEEIEPDTSKGKVKVTFTNDYVKMLSTDVYHIVNDQKAESLKLDKSKNTVTGETKSFSTYVIDFNYDNSKIYYLYGDSNDDSISVLASKLLAQLLTDGTTIDESKITNVTSTKSYITASKADNKWTISANLNTTEDVSQSAEVTITYDGNDYTINVKYTKTDTRDTTGKTDSWITNFSYTKSGSTVTLTKFTGTVTSISIYPTVTINNTEYNVKVTGSLFQNTSNYSPKAANLVEINFVGGKSGVAADSDLGSLFYNCTSLKKVDLSGLDTSNTTDMSAMFSGCTSLVNDGKSSYIKFMNAEKSHFTTEKVNSMYRMFYNDTSLLKLDLSNFNTSTLNETFDMFSGDVSLEYINLSSFKGAPSAVAVYMGSSGVLRGCSNLKTLVLGENWQTPETEPSKVYLPLELTGYWKNISTSNVYTSAELDSSSKNMAGTYIKVNLAGPNPIYETSGSRNGQNIWEAHNPSRTFHGYCLNQNLHDPSGTYDKVSLDTGATSNTAEKGSHSNYIEDYISSNSGYANIGGKAPNMTKALIALIYYSESLKSEIIKEAKGNNIDIDDTDVEQCFQAMIWLYTDHYNWIDGVDYNDQARNQLINSGNATSKSVIKLVDYDSQNKVFTFYKLNADASRTKIYTFTLADHNYDKIEGNYSLAIYVPSDDNEHKGKVQNLLSIEGAINKVYAGVKVKKIDQFDDPVSDVKFSVYKGIRSPDGTISKGEYITSFATNALGYGGLFGMDQTTGLPIGDYVLQEISTPKGYNTKKEDQNYKEYPFSVTENDNQKVILVGDGEGDNKTILNKKDTSYQGAGLKILKKDESGNALAGAQFKIYEDSSDSEKLKSNRDNAKVYTTDSYGIIQTGLTELELNHTYVVEEVSAPKGFSKASIIKVTVDKDNVGKYIEKNITDHSKTGTVNIEASKKLLGTNGNSIQLKGNEFEFGLYDSDEAGKQPIMKTFNNEDGTIVFNNVPVKANGGDSVYYYIKEIKPSNPEKDIEYDTHSEKVTISIKDNGTDKLECTPIYDSDGAVFTNTQNITYEYGGKLTIKKKVTGFPVSSNDVFTFRVSIISPIVDLPDKLKSSNSNCTAIIKSTSGSSGKSTNITNKFINSLVKTGTDKNTNLTTYVGKIELKKDQGCYITGLPTKVGTVTPTFKVDEDKYSYYETKNEIENGTNVTKSGNSTASADITKDDTVVTFTNDGKFIVPTSADTFTRSPFWITIALGALVVIYIKKRKKKINDK